VRARAGQQCERCGVNTGSIVLRNDRDLEDFIVLHEGGEGSHQMMMLHWRAELARFWPSAVGEPWRDPIRVILTVAHLDHDPTNNGPENLAALCQLHHLRHDADEHARNAAATRKRQRAAALAASGQLGLFTQEPRS
jgi:hypothetical protein